MASTKREQPPPVKYLDIVRAHQALTEAGGLKPIRDLSRGECLALMYAWVEAGQKKELYRTIHDAVRAFGTVADDPRIQHEARLHGLARRFAHEVDVLGTTERWAGVGDEYSALAAALGARRKEVAHRLDEKIPKIHLDRQEL